MKSKGIIHNLKHSLCECVAIPSGVQLGGKATLFWVNMLHTRIYLHSSSETNSPEDKGTCKKGYKHVWRSRAAHMHNILFSRALNSSSAGDAHAATPRSFIFFQHASASFSRAVCVSLLVRENRAPGIKLALVLGCESGCDLSFASSRRNTV